MFKDAVLLLHPIIAISVVFPLMGLIVNRGLQVRQRRLQLASSDKSKVPPVVGQEHVQGGHWLTIGVVGITLIALANDILAPLSVINCGAKIPFRWG